MALTQDQVLNALRDVEMKRPRALVAVCAVLGVILWWGWDVQGPSLSAAEPHSEIAQHLHALQDEDYHVRWQALEALGKLGPDSAPAVPALIDALDDEYCRYRAIHVLGQIGSAAAPAVPMLVDRLTVTLANAEYRDRETEVAGIIWTLGRIGPPAMAALPVLRQALRDADSNIRYEAAHAVGELGAGAREAIPDLEVALHDREYVGLYVYPYGQTVGEAAAQSLNKLRGAISSGPPGGS